MNLTRSFTVLWFLPALAFACLFLAEGMPAQTLVWGFSAVVAVTFFWRTQERAREDA